MPLSAIALNCTLKRSGSTPSSTDKMIELIAGELRKLGVEVRHTIRIADHDIKPGVSSDDGDEWPQVRQQVLDCDIVGNEDGAHHVAATLFQALNDAGWTIAAGASDYWVGEAMQKVDFKDLPRVPEPVSRGAAMRAANAVHLATMLKDNPYPGISGG